MPRRKTIDHTEILLDILKQNIEVMNDVKNTIKIINDEHSLGMQTIASNTAALKDNTTSIKELIMLNKQFMSFIFKILMITVVALVALAGAEKVLKFLP